MQGPLGTDGVSDPLMSSLSHVLFFSAPFLVSSQSLMQTLASQNLGTLMF